MTVTPQTPFRTAGNTTRASFKAVLSRSIVAGVMPPPLAEADAIYDALAPHKLTRLAAGMAWIERRNETDPGGLAYYPRSHFNLWAVKTSTGAWARYPSYAMAAETWGPYVLGPTYRDLDTIAEFISRYAPDFENDTNRYIGQLVDEINRLPLRDGGGITQPMPTVTFAGAGVAVPLDVPFRQVLLPTSQTNQRPGTRMTPALYVQHETGNPRAGADAEMHRQYLFNGAEGQRLGYHLTVDKDECIQMIPFNEIAWHGGDGGGQCNMRGIACELTVEDHNRHKIEARANAEKVAAAVMLAMNLTRLEQHHFCSGKDCPHYIRRDGYWPTFKANVQAILDGGVTPDPVPPPVSVPGLPAWLTFDHLKAAFPDADPVGIVTSALIRYIAKSGTLPIYRERRAASENGSLWLFDRVTIIHQGTRAWAEGEEPA